MSLGINFTPLFGFYRGSGPSPSKAVQSSILDNNKLPANSTTFWLSKKGAWAGQSDLRGAHHTPGYPYVPSPVWVISIYLYQNTDTDWEKDVDDAN